MQTAKFNYLKGLGEWGVSFEGTTVAGREISIDIDRATLLKIAELLKKEPYCGHAVWHYNNPDADFPCSTCTLLRERKVKSEPKEIVVKTNEEELIIGC